MVDQGETHDPFEGRAIVPTGRHAVVPVRHVPDPVQRQQQGALSNVLAWLEVVIQLAVVVHGAL
ncbi:hypothetical protein D3C80_1631980 [compost metagenome]